MASKPFYSAVLLDPANLNSELTPLGIAYATSSDEATQFAKSQGKAWLRANEVDLAILHIVVDGHAIYSEHIRGHD
jgi:hypothetical protein